MKGSSLFVQQKTLDTIAILNISLEYNTLQEIFVIIAANGSPNFSGANLHSLAKTMGFLWCAISTTLSDGEVWTSASSDSLGSSTLEHAEWGLVPHERSGSDCYHNMNSICLPNQSEDVWMMYPHSWSVRRSSTQNHEWVHSVGVLSSQPHDSWLQSQRLRFFHLQSNSAACPCWRCHVVSVGYIGPKLTLLNERMCSVPNGYMWQSPVGRRISPWMAAM